MSPVQLIFVALLGLGLLALFVWWISAIERAQAALASQVALLGQQVAEMEPFLRRAAAQLETGRGERDWRAPARVVESRP